MRRPLAQLIAASLAENSVLDPLIVEHLADSLVYDLTQEGRIEWESKTGGMRLYRKPGAPFDVECNRLLVLHYPEGQ